MTAPREILGLIPARGGSKSIPAKNLTPLAGRPLIDYTFEAAKGSRRLTRLIISTDDPATAELAAQAGIEAPFLRPAELAGDDSPTIEAVEHALARLAEIDSFRPDIVVLLQPTSPLRRAGHIDAALELMLDQAADSVVSITGVDHHSNPVSVMEFNSAGFLEPWLKDQAEPILRRQDKPVVWARNGAIYACLREVIETRHALIGPKCAAYKMSRRESLDVDEPLDLLFCEALLAERGGNF